MNHNSLIARRMILSLGVILFAACTPTSPTTVPELPTFTSVPPTAKLAPPTNTPVIPIATPVPPTATAVIPTATYTEQVELIPSPRAFSSIAYDSESNKVILFGGSKTNWKTPASFNDETWAYDVSTNIWTEMKPPSAPDPRAAAAMAYDAESDRVILFGGDIYGRIGVGDTWSYDYNTNTWKKMKYKGPNRHHGCSLAYDSESDRIILFGGYNASDSTFFQETWAYDYNTDTWTEMKPAVSPLGRNFHVMTYDTKADRILLWGGDITYLAKPNVPKNASVWAYDYNTNTWQAMISAERPPDGPFSAMAYDATADRTILYGGYDSGTSDMWAYDNNKNAWTILKSTVNPGILSRQAMVYIPGINRLFLFGGQVGEVFGNNIDKTWLYDYTTNTWTEVMPNGE